MPRILRLGLSASALPGFDLGEEIALMMWGTLAATLVAVIVAVVLSVRANRARTTHWLDVATALAVDLPSGSEVRATFPTSVGARYWLWLTTPEVFQPAKFELAVSLRAGGQTLFDQLLELTLDTSDEDINRVLGLPAGGFSFPFPTGSERLHRVLDVVPGASVCEVAVRFGPKDGAAPLPARLVVTRGQPPDFER